MNAPLNHTTINMDRSFFAIIIPGDNSMTVEGEAQAHHEYRSLFFNWIEQQATDAGTIARMKRGIRVIEFNPVEGWARDVTTDFAEWADLAEEYA